MPLLTAMFGYYEGKRRRKKPIAIRAMLWQLIIIETAKVVEKENHYHKTHAFYIQKKTHRYMYVYVYLVIERKRNVLMMRNEEQFYKRRIRKENKNIHTQHRRPIVLSML